MHFGTIIFDFPFSGGMTGEQEETNHRHHCVARHQRRIAATRFCIYSSLATQYTCDACICAFQFRHKHGRAVVRVYGREFESCVPDAIILHTNIMYVRLPLNVTCVCSVHSLIFCFSFPFGSSHARTETTFVLCTFISSPARITNARTNKKLPSSFYTYLFCCFSVLVFFSVRILLTMALCGGLCCVKCVRINSTKRFTFAFVWLCVVICFLYGYSGTEI